jgi:hypothetical protein
MFGNENGNPVAFPIGLQERQKSFGMLFASWTKAYKLQIGFTACRLCRCIFSLKD